MQKCAVCSDHAALRQVGDVCMQPVCGADSDVMIVYQDNKGACLRRINVGYSLMNILYYIIFSVSFQYLLINAFRRTFQL